MHTGRSKSPLVRYAVALGAVALALALTTILAPYLARVIFVLFWPAVVAAAWYGGLRPALVATVLAVLAVDLLFVPPIGGLGPTDPRDLVALAAFAVLAAGVALLTDRLREEHAKVVAAERDAVDRAELLQEQAAELEAQTEEAQVLTEELEESNERLRELMTSAKAARDDAEAANRAKTDFLAVMSHELRTPLNAIAGHTELVELGVHGPVTDAQREALARIQRSQRHLLGLINDVLNFAKLEAGHVVYDIGEVPLHEAVEGIEPLVSSQLRAKALRLSPCDCGGTPVARADREKVRQVLLNLLSNAIKFTPEGGTIAVGCVEAGGRIGVRISDTGIGIPADKLEQVFAPFVQVNRGLSTAHEGTGLGLAISRDLARGMGGDLTVESREGDGSAFTLLLPVAQPRSAPSAALAS